MIIDDNMDVTRSYHIIVVHLHHVIMTTPCNITMFISGREHSMTWCSGYGGCNVDRAAGSAVCLGVGNLVAVTMDGIGMDR